jgi:hypothetical protein
VVARKCDLDEDEARDWRMAKILGLRSFIGALLVVFIAWLLASPPPPITKAEMDAHRKERELMRTSGGLHH